MESRPFVRGRSSPSETANGPKPVLLRKHATTLPVPAIPRIEPGRLLLIPLQADSERDALARVWENAGGKVQRVGRVWAPDPSWKQNSICLFGNAMFCQILAHALDLQLLGPTDDFLATLPKELLGRRVFVSTLDQFKHLAYPCFVRSLPAKLFTSGVVSSAQRLRQLTSGLDGYTGLLVSEVFTVEAQARAFLYDRRLLDCVLTKGQGDLEAAGEVAEQVARLHHAPFGFVVDLGRQGDRWFVLQTSAAWSARLKGCEPDKVVLSIAAGTRA